MREDWQDGWLEMLGINLQESEIISAILFTDPKT